MTHRRASGSPRGCARWGDAFYEEVTPAGLRDALEAVPADAAKVARRSDAARYSPLPPAKPSPPVSLFTASPMSVNASPIPVEHTRCICISSANLANVRRQ